MIRFFRYLLLTRARVTALAIAVIYFFASYTLRTCFTCFGGIRVTFFGADIPVTLFILIDFTRRSIDCLGMNDSAEGCVEGMVVVCVEFDRDG